MAKKMKTIVYWDYKALMEKNGNHHLSLGFRDTNPIAEKQIESKWRLGLYGNMWGFGLRACQLPPSSDEIQNSKYQRQLRADENEGSCWMCLPADWIASLRLL